MPPEPQTCEVRDWPVFGPGWWKGRWYGVEDCRRLGQNFDRLSRGDTPHVRVMAGLGHDRTQEFTRSLGFPAVGRVVDVQVRPDGVVVMRRIVGVPLEVGGAINYPGAGIDGGSIELDFERADPADPGRTIPGPILTGVSFLGGEPPALQAQKFPPPVAVFADGRRVPPRFPDRWLAAVADVKQALAVRPRRDAFESASRFSVAFSERYMDPTLAAKLQAAGLDPNDPALAGMAPQQLEALVAQYGASGMQPAQFSAMFSAFSKVFSAGPSPAPAPAANEPAWMSAFSAAENDATNPGLQAFAKGCKAAFSAMQEQLGAQDRALSEIQAQKSAEKTAAMSLRVQAGVDNALEKGSIQANEKDTYLSAGRAKAASGQVFSAGPHAGKSELDVWLAELAARPPLAAYKPPADPTHAPADDLDPFTRRALGHIRGAGVTDPADDYLRPAPAAKPARVAVAG